MCKKINTQSKNTYSIFREKIIIISLLSILFISCQKEACSPQEITNNQSAKSEANNVPPLLQISSVRLQLLQANATHTAVSLHWAKFSCNPGEIKDYKIEASMAGSSRFTDWVEIGSTVNLSIDFTVQEFNKQIRKLFVTGLAEDVVIRVKCNRINLDPFYSLGECLQVTTYQPAIDYDNSHIFRIPGNFENWKLDQAPKIISPKMDGEYEGYIDFSNAYSQFLMVKSDPVWNTLLTYYYIGASKFGFAGNMFSIKDGAGIYKFNASTNTNVWSCTKINSWSVNGTAITTDGNTDVEMIRNPYNISWQITGNFKEGSFIFRANKSNAIVFGHNASSGIGVPDYNGTKITISKAGNYFIELSLSAAGNYSYSVLRNI